jgi:multiple antibiotic resistance protein
MLEIFLSSFITLLVVVDPIGTVVTFAGLTASSTETYRRSMALKGTLIAGCILLFFTLTGDNLLSIMGISLPAFRIAGGILLFFLAIDMVLVRPSGLSSTTSQENEEAEHKQDISVFPLAIPLIAGPGAITSMILLSDQGQWSATVSVTLTLFLILLLTWILLRLAGRILRIIGVTGAGVISRVLGVILAALAVQFVLDGIRAVFG